ncbi:type II toxin-antitoxin system RelE/ParE family toxin [Luteimonas lutimaris]|uniref:Type II toxin-antitoxin system RelE/ParE family toxin n=1 Tax=Luteimonas lutimaris TaxID=698645 RepID=A0ABP7MI43_9GAMM
MSFHVRITKAAQDDLERLLDFLAPVDYPAALRARAAIERGYGFLSEMPFAFRKVNDANPFLRELVIPFGGAGYVALFEIEDEHTITILAVRHQREDDYH